MILLAGTLAWSQLAVSGIQRVIGRKAFVQRGKFDASPQEMRKEFAKQMRLLDNAAIRLIHARLQRNDLSPDARVFMSEVLSEALASRAGSTRGWA